MLVVRKEIKAKLAKEESLVYLDRVDLLVNGVPKVKLGQEALPAHVDCRGILVKEDHQDQLALQVLQVHREYRECKA